MGRHISIMSHSSGFIKSIDSSSLFVILNFDTDTLSQFHTTNKTVTHREYLRPLVLRALDDQIDCSSTHRRDLKFRDRTLLVLVFI
jgi:hypothetical protein